MTEKQENAISYSLQEKLSEKSILKKKTNTIQKTKLKTKIDHDEKALMSPQ
jgi:hypothetical protein